MAVTVEYAVDGEEDAALTDVLAVEAEAEDEPGVG